MAEPEELSTYHTVSTTKPNGWKGFKMQWASSQTVYHERTYPYTIVNWPLYISDTADIRFIACQIWADAALICQRHCAYVQNIPRWFDKVLQVWNAFFDTKTLQDGEIMQESWSGQDEEEECTDLGKDGSRSPAISNTSKAYYTGFSVKFSWDMLRTEFVSNKITEAKSYKN